MLLLLLHGWSRHGVHVLQSRKGISGSRKRLLLKRLPKTPLEAHAASLLLRSVRTRLRLTIGTPPLKGGPQRMNRRSSSLRVVSRLLDRGSKAGILHRLLHIQRRRRSHGLWRGHWLDVRGWKPSFFAVAGPPPPGARLTGFRTNGCSLGEGKLALPSISLERMLGDELRHGCRFLQSRLEIFVLSFWPKRN